MDDIFFYFQASTEKLSSLLPRVLRIEKIITFLQEVHTPSLTFIKLLL